MNITFPWPRARTKTLAGFKHATFPSMYSFAREKHFLILAAAQESAKRRSKLISIFDE